MSDGSYGRGTRHRYHRSYSTPEYPPEGSWNANRGAALDCSRYGTKCLPYLLERIHVPIWHGGVNIKIRKKMEPFWYPRSIIWDLVTQFL
ncbi:MAG: hypothetical protein QW292_13915 [Candidatus Parvarchaeota archaeon]